MTYLSDIIFLIGSIGLFILATKIISEGLTNLTSGKLRKMFSKVSNNKSINVGIGAATAAITQSSSATTVMTIGLVNASIITLLQATYIIMGANIGTTISAQIAALQTFKFTDFFLLFVLVGVLIDIAAKKDTLKKAGKTLMGFGLIFLAIKCMTLAVSSLKDSQLFIDALTGVTNPILLLLIGLVITAIMQSSAACTGLLIAIVANGLAIGNGGNAILFVILGTNIGTCVTALMAGTSANTNGKRAAFIHLIFNVLGSVMFFIFLLLYKDFYTGILIKIFGNATTSVAMFHTLFNVITTLFLLPLASLLVKLAIKCIKDKEDKKKYTKYIDDLQLKNPSIALGTTTKEIIALKEQAYTNILLAKDDLNNVSVNNFSKMEEINDNINKSNYQITEFLVKLNSLKLAKKEQIRVSSFYRVLADVLRISDLALGVERCTDRIVKDNIKFTSAVYEDINKMFVLIDELQKSSDTIFETLNIKELADLEKVENNLDDLRAQNVENHIGRIKSGECQLIHGSLFERIVNDLERVGDHLTYIARSITDNKLTLEEYIMMQKK